MNQRIGIFGKIPTTGDFIAHNASFPVTRALQEWFQLEVNNLAQLGKPLPAAPIRFLFRDLVGSGACLGVFGASRDTVGRDFPLTVFAYIDMPVACHRFSSLATAYAPMLDGAVGVLQQAQQLEPQALFAMAGALPGPSPQELEDARVWTHQALEATPGQTLLEALFGSMADGVHYHGLNMFLTACGQVRGGDPGKASIVLECPASDDVQLAFWLRFAQETLQWNRAPPSLFWTDTDSPDSRLLIALGTPTPGTLHFLSDPTAVAERLWPMRTTSQASIDAGRRSLARVLPPDKPPPATAADLLSALAR